MTGEAAQNFGLINKRMEAGAANATINRELAALKRSFNLAANNAALTEFLILPC